MVHPFGAFLQYRDGSQGVDFENLTRVTSAGTSSRSPV
jgi:hypothetical protein